MHDPFENNVAVLHRIYSPPITLAYSENAGFSNHRDDGWMQRIRRGGDFLEALQKSFSVGLRHTRELFDDSRWDEKGHALIFSNSE